MTQSLRVRRFLGLILVVAVVAIAVTGCAKRSAVSPEGNTATSGGFLDKGNSVGASGTESSAPASTTTYGAAGGDRPQDHLQCQSQS